MSMTKRTLLWQAIKFMFIFVAFAFVFVLFRSLSGPPMTGSTLQSFDDVVISQTALRRDNGERVWVTRLSEMQRQQAQQLASLLRDSNAGCKPQVVICVIRASTSRSGIELAFAERFPAQLKGGVLWFGGFVDPTTGAVFDRLGRAYKDVRSNDERNSLDIVQ